MNTFAMVMIVAIVVAGLVLSANSEALRRDWSLRRWRRACLRGRLRFDPPKLMKQRRVAWSRRYEGAQRSLNCCGFGS